MTILSNADLASFARNGYLRVSGLVDEDACEALISLTQRQFPPHWDVSEPETLTGDVRDSCHIGAVEWFKGALKYQGPEVRDAPVATTAFALGSKVAVAAEALIGAPLAAHFIRGLYPILPLPNGSAGKARHPHVESHPVELVAFAYLDDVGEGGAGLSVWPGSHRDIYPAMLSKLDFSAGDGFDDVYDTWAGLHPIELQGRRGDVIFTHHRLLHGPSVNTSSAIRYALLCDYKRENWADLCREAPTTDMWADWPTIAALDRDTLSAPADISLDVRAWKRRDPARLIDNDATTPAALRKQDAAMLVSLRRQGDFWLQASDSDDSRHGVRLTSRGSDLKAAGVKIWIDDAEVSSTFNFDIFHRLDVVKAPIRIRVSGADMPIHIKIVRLTLPFAESEIVALWTAKPSDDFSEFVFDDQVASTLMT